MRLTLARALVAVALLGVACNKPAPPPPPAATDLKTDDDKTLYALGMMLGRNVTPLHLTAPEMEIVKKGLDDIVNGKTGVVDLQVYGPKVQQFAQGRISAGAQVEKAHSAAYEDAAAKEAGAIKTPSGLIIKTLTPGNGPSPVATDVVSVHYEGKLTDGTVFDSSLKRGQPTEFPLNGVIPCWTEALQRMKVGEKARLVCPASLAYGDKTMGQIPAGATLTFEVQLLEIKGKK
jgi:FKBP-type peptidyl-prolyl cis-trans isomerase FkpA